MKNKLLTLIFTCIAASSVQASECTTFKEAFLPQWEKHATSNYRIYVSNISEQNVDVEIKFFNSANI